MLGILSIWLAVIAFFSAGLVNAIGTPATQESFVRWGYPRWWSRVTGGLEMAVAILIALPDTRGLGLVFGAIIIAAAASTVLRHREFAHLAPLTLFVALLTLAGVASSMSGSFPAF
jgi:hypothetical protein